MNDGYNAVRGCLIGALLSAVFWLLLAAVLLLTGVL